MDSPGPVFSGNDAQAGIIKIFGCVKFRTMQVNKFSDGIQATLGDSRVTKIEHLCVEHIDELPQFFNVLWELCL
jgi:lipopolysaccharide/colanic/teichoic acid biosynthesis glycosyltransferase